MATTPARLFESWVQAWQEGWDAEIGEIVHALEARSTKALAELREHMGRELALERSQHEQELTALRNEMMTQAKQTQVTEVEARCTEALAELREHTGRELALERSQHERELASLRNELTTQAEQTQATLDAIARGLREFGPSLIVQHEEGIADLRQELLSRQGAAELEVKSLATLVRTCQADSAVGDNKTNAIGQEVAALSSAVDSVRKQSEQVPGALSGLKEEISAETEQLREAMDQKLKDMEAQVLEKHEAAMRETAAISDAQSELKQLHGGLAAQSSVPVEQLAVLDQKVAALSGLKEEISAETEQLREAMEQKVAVLSTEINAVSTRDTLSISECIGGIGEIRSRVDKIEQQIAESGKNYAYISEGEPPVPTIQLANEVLEADSAELSELDTTRSAATFQEDSTWIEELAKYASDILGSAQHDTAASAFRALDKDNDGSITVAEFEQGLRGMGGELSTEDIQTLVSAIDADGDGNVSLEEFKAAFAPDEVSPKSREQDSASRRSKSIAFFSDTAGDSDVVLRHTSSASVVGAFKARQAMLQAFDSVAAAFAYLDKDGDGSITMQELAAGMASFDASVCQRTAVLSGPSESQSMETLRADVLAGLDAAGFSAEVIEHVTVEDTRTSGSSSECYSLVTFQEQEVCTRLLAMHENIVVGPCDAAVDWSTAKCLSLEELEAEGVQLPARESATVTRHVSQVGFGMSVADLEAIVEACDADGDGSIDLQEFTRVFDAATDTELKQEVRAGQMTINTYKEIKQNAYRGSITTPIAEEEEEREGEAEGEEEAAEAESAGDAEVANACLSKDDWKELQSAATNGDIAKLSAGLKVAGTVDLEAAGDDGCTCLYLAANSGHADAVKALVAAGSNVNVVAARTKFTPLHAAAQVGHAEVVKVLLEAGADPGLLNKTGKTALDLARRKHRADVIVLLEPTDAAEADSEPDRDLGSARHSALSMEGETEGAAISKVKSEPDSAPESVSNAHDHDKDALTPQPEIDGTVVPSQEVARLTLELDDEEVALAKADKEAEAEAQAWSVRMEAVIAAKGLALSGGESLAESNSEPVAGAEERFMHSPPCSGKLKVGVIGCRHLLPADDNGRSDVYVTLQLGKHKKVQTTVQSKTLDPQFDESFELSLEVESSNPTPCLLVEVWDRDRGARDDFLGQVSVSLGEAFETGWVDTEVRRSYVLTDPASRLVDGSGTEGKELAQRKASDDESPYGSVELRLSFMPDDMNAAAAYLLAQQQREDPPAQNASKSEVEVGIVENAAVHVEAGMGPAADEEIDLESMARALHAEPAEPNAEPAADEEIDLEAMAAELDSEPAAEPAADDEIDLEAVAKELDAETAERKANAAEAAAKANQEYEAATAAVVVAEAAVADAHAKEPPADMFPPKTFAGVKHNKKKVKMTLGASGLVVVEETKKASKVCAYPLSRLSDYKVTGKKKTVFQVAAANKAGSGRKVLEFELKEAEQVSKSLRQADNAVTSWRKALIQEAEATVAAATAAATQAAEEKTKQEDEAREAAAVHSLTKEEERVGPAAEEEGANLAVGADAEQECEPEQEPEQEPEPESEPPPNPEDSVREDQEDAAAASSDQHVASEVLRYRALQEGQIRAEAAMTSEKVGRLSAGQDIEVVDRVTVDGTTRVRFDRGWVSVTSKQGKALLELISGPEQAEESGESSADSDDDTESGSDDEEDSDEETDASAESI